MTRSFLYLVGPDGEPVDADVAAAVHRAYRILTARFPEVDSALIANWAEEAATYLQGHLATIKHPQPLAYQRVFWRIMNWKKTGRATEQYGGTTAEVTLGIAASADEDCTSRIFFQQIRPALNDRELQLLQMALEDKETSEMATLFGVTRRSIQMSFQHMRVKIKMYAEGLQGISYRAREVAMVIKSDGADGNGRKYKAVSLRSHRPWKPQNGFHTPAAED